MKALGVYIFDDYERWLCVEVSQPDWNLTASHCVRVLEDQTWSGRLGYGFAAEKHLQSRTLLLPPCFTLEMVCLWWCCSVLCSPNILSSLMGRGSVSVTSDQGTFFQLTLNSSWEFPFSWLLSQTALMNIGAAGAFNSFRVVMSVSVASGLLLALTHPPVGTFKQASSFDLSMMALAEVWDVWSRLKYSNNYQM